MLALGKIGDKRGARGARRAAAQRAATLQPTVAASAICLLGINCASHLGYLQKVLAFAEDNPGYQELVRARPHRPRRGRRKRKPRSVADVARRRHSVRGSAARAARAGRARRSRCATRRAAAGARGPTRTATARSSCCAKGSTCSGGSRGGAVLRRRAARVLGRRPTHRHACGKLAEQLIGKTGFLSGGEPPEIDDGLQGFGRRHRRRQRNGAPHQGAGARPRSPPVCCPRLARSAGCSASTPGWREPVLVSSADGVGTKLKVAFMTEPPRHDRRRPRQPLRQRHPRAGRAAALLPRLPRDRQAAARRRGADRRRAGARVPGQRLRAARRRDGGDAGLLRRRRIRPRRVHRRRRRADAADRRAAASRRATCCIGLPSTGLHTNGYSLARRIVFEKLGLTVDSHVPELGGTVGEVLLTPHRSYLHGVYPLVAKGAIKGMAHITGGGITDNLPRMLPPGIARAIDRGAGRSPPLVPVAAASRARCPRRHVPDLQHGDRPDPGLHAGARRTRCWRLCSSRRGERRRDRRESSLDDREVRYA